jgi:hypothetical protein
VFLQGNFGRLVFLGKKILKTFCGPAKGSLYSLLSDSVIKSCGTEARLGAAALKRQNYRKSCNNCSKV